MKYLDQKPYHEMERELWECMTEKERDDYWLFLEAHPELENEIYNCDRRYYWQHENEGDLPEGCKIEHSDGCTSPIPAKRKGGMCIGPDYLDMIEQATYDRKGEEYYRDPLIRKAVHSLSERQRQAMKYSVLYEIPTTKLAKVWGCNERNVRKLRERALHNVGKHYAKALKKKPGHTLAEREFLEWYEAQEAAKTPPVRRKKRKTDQYHAKRYATEYGQFVASVPIPTTILKESATV